MNIAWILCETCMKLYAHFIHKKSIVYSRVESVVVIGTRKHFEVTNMYKLFCHRKCTVAAAYNLSVHKLQRIMLHRKYMGYFCQAITLLFKGLLKRFLF